jgi:hypothetical protein
VQQGTNLSEVTPIVLKSLQYCSCSSLCGNRVAQKPRDVPIEVFKTKQCGWGARCPVALPKGKVLGIYMGFVCSCLHSQVLNSSLQDAAVSSSILASADAHLIP